MSRKRNPVKKLRNIKKNVTVMILKAKNDFKILQIIIQIKI